MGFRQVALHLLWTLHFALQPSDKWQTLIRDYMGHKSTTLWNGRHGDCDDCFNIWSTNATGASVPFWSILFQPATQLWSVLSYLWTLWMRICQECTQTNLELVIFDLAILRSQWERMFCISSFQRDTSEHVIPVWHCRGIIPTPMFSSISVFKSLPSHFHTCELGNET